ncbi:MAG TPA: AbrB/MazE/SpoVT family DNA-binding domain-containing protein [Tepidisphaeraceae bacterium]|nr:AbrB/MazE/SpoVT family DNA-binding domain-containing protein [Tepidisphaeraceae bacterium]
MKVKTRPKSKSPARRATLTAKLVRIGNSRGIRLPKAIIEQAGLEGAIEITVRGDRVILRSSQNPENPRAGWEEAIKKALAEHGDDADEFREWQEITNEFDKKEWTW